MILIFRRVFQICQRKLAGLETAELELHPKIVMSKGREFKSPLAQSRSCNTNNDFFSLEIVGVFAKNWRLEESDCTCGNWKFENRWSQGCWESVLVEWARIFSTTGWSACRPISSSLSISILFQVGRVNVDGFQGLREKSMICAPKNSPSKFLPQIRSKTARI